jgi:hypothetical protein
LVDEAIVLALRGGAEMRTRQGERQGGGEVRGEAFHGLLAYWVQPRTSLQNGEVLNEEGKAEMRVEGRRPGSTDGTESYARWPSVALARRMEPYNRTQQKNLKNLFVR